MTSHGHFDDERREYVITSPDTPRSWANYLGSTEYGAIITNNAGGYSFFKSAAQGRFTRLRFNAVPLDQPGRYIYVRDAGSGDYWSTSWQPVGKALDGYRTTCRHGTGYTVIESEYTQIRTSTTYFVPLGAHYEVWLVRVENRAAAPRTLDLFTYVEYASEWHVWHDTFNLQYAQYIVQCSVEGGLLSHDISDNLPERPDAFEFRDQSRHSFLGLIGAEVTGFDTDRESFLGAYRTYANPIVVERGACTGSLAYGDNACGTLATRMTLAPGESREFAVVMGVGRAKVAGRAALAEMESTESVHRALEEVRTYWHSKIGSVSVKTPDSDFDSMVNVWNAYNCLITYAWSRAASLVYSGERDGLGYRDTVQDLLGVMAAIPDDARARLELMLTGQVSTGGAMPVVKPFAHKPGHEPAPKEDEYRSDDSLWLFDTVPAYVKESGDLAFFDRVLPYADAGEATVLGHLRRALEFNLDRRGVHGLPCGLLADWNDTLKLGYRGESVMVAFQLRHGLRTYIEIAERLEREAEVAWARKALASLDASIQQHAWDGAWFVRAFRENGSVIGTKADPEGSIFLNAQSWAVISGGATPEQAARAMESVRERLATPYGLMLCDPPFEKTPCAEVRAVLFNPGTKENGGIFCHPQGWAIIAETLLGQGTLAYDYYRAYMPAAYNDRAEVREIEPYVHCQSTHGRHSPRHGASRLPWLSGTATWSYVTATHHILGVRPDWDGLVVSPCIPAAWDGFKMKRRFRGATYEITVANPRHVQRGVRSLKVDGKIADSSLPIPQAAAGSEVRVEVELG
ncbi:MAG: N,N'-diacetylchitobiose phosphorylase [Polyangiaceae bacterium]|jgi:cellobiose phosphorylase